MYIKITCPKSIAQMVHLPNFKADELHFTCLSVDYKRHILKVYKLNGNY